MPDQIETLTGKLVALRSETGLHAAIFECDGCEVFCWIRRATRKALLGRQGETFTVRGMAHRETPGGRITVLDETELVEARDA